MKTTARLTETQECILSQLSEDTGKSIMDSGGTDGRHWQTWAKTNNIDWSEGLRIDKYGWTIPIHVYMDSVFERTDVAIALEKTITKQLKADGNEDPYLMYSNGDEIIDVLKEMGAIETVYGGLKWDNTYNGESDLSQVLQLMIFEYGDIEYAIVETHNGADVRGGYSLGKVYRIKDLNSMMDITVSRQTESDDEVSYDKMEWNEEKGEYIHTETGETIDFSNSNVQ